MKWAAACHKAAHEKIVRLDFMGGPRGDRRRSERVGRDVAFKERGGIEFRANRGRISRPELRRDRCRRHGALSAPPGLPLRLKFVRPLQLGATKLICPRAGGDTMPPPTRFSINVCKRKRLCNGYLYLHSNVSLRRSFFGRKIWQKG